MNQKNFLPSAKEIYDYLNERVIGQDDAKKTLSLAVYNHYKRLTLNTGNNTMEQNVIGIDKSLADVTSEKSNILMLGQTGTGKTYMIKQIAKLLKVPCYIADMTKVTESGYVGDDVESILTGLLMECDYDPDIAGCGIVVCDEIDKLVRHTAGQSLTRDVGGVGVQQSLLKILEGSVVNVPPMGGRKHPEQPGVPVDTTNILFIGLGAFEHLDDYVKYRLRPDSKVGFNTEFKGNSKYSSDYNYFRDVNPEDLKDYGFISEFIGRFPVITYTNPLEESDLVKILTEPVNSVIKQYQKLLAADNINLSFEKRALKEIARIANEKKTGARALRGIIEKVLFNIMFENSGNTEPKQVTVKFKDVRKTAA